MAESDEVEENRKQLPTILNPFIFCTNLISFEADILSALASPFLSLFSFVFSLLFRRAPPPEEEEGVPARGRGSLLLWRVVMGLLAAAYVGMVLIVVMVVAAAVGVGLVRAWAEEPVCVRESLQFDYTDAHPTAVFSFGERAAGVPVGHTAYVSLVLLMPDSDYNRDVGIFQLTAELISIEGNIIAKSSHPSMLKFRSWPIRYTQTFMMGVPLLLGITTETQRITFPILKHKEAAYPRTEDVRITLIPRAGTFSLPQFYDAQVVIRSRPPWMKELVYNWKLTFCVWTTMYVFVIMVMVLVLFFKPLIFPVMSSPFGKSEQGSCEESVPESAPTREVSESVKRWQTSRSKRKAALLHGVVPEGSICSSASSMTVSQGEVGQCFEEGSGDSESVCSKGF